jgi:isoquinoline 1-oxidoreductase beta subunit
MDHPTEDSREPQPAAFGHATRREVLVAAAMLTVGSQLPEAAANTPQAGTRGKELVPGPFVRIGSDDSVTVIAKHLEMGQGVFTGLATIIAEELDADWSQIRVEAAPADAKLYNNLTFGPIQGTGGSSSIANSFDQLRLAGATARTLLVAAAAQRWKVAAAEITVKNGTLAHAASGRTARFGELVAQAAKLKVPKDVRPKPVNDYARIGKDAARVDSLAKSNGSAIFTQDIQLPGMLVAAVVHPPRFGAKVKSFDAAKAQAVKGVKSVVAFQTPTRAGVAVLASDFWSAKQGRDALSVEWDESAAFKRSSVDLFAEYRALAAQPGGTSARSEGNVEQALGAAARTLTATYEFPFLAHAAMEPMNCVVRLGPNQCEIWNGVQVHTSDQYALAQFLKLPLDRVMLNQLYAGGSFGRRASTTSDYILEAAAIAKAAGVSVPVKLVWTREEDMRAGFYRPMYVHTLTAGLDAAGKLTAWRHRIAGQSILAGTAFGGQNPDPTSVEGAVNLPYEIPNLAVALHTTQLQVPVLWWRSVGSTHTAFATECFLDEIARATAQDPLALRTNLLAAKHARHRKVLELVAEKSGWRQRPKDEFWGLALHESFKSVVAQVAQVKRTAQGLRLQRVVCAVDCGLAVNPNIVAMQMESGIGYGLAAALSGAITLEDGRVQQGNFDDYPVLRINQMPEVEVYIVPSKNQPTGVGEPATPVIAPALANALALARGEPIRSLPLSAQGIALV